MTLCFVLGYLEFLHIVEGALYPARTRALYDRRLCRGCDLSASWPCPLAVLPVMSVSLWLQCFCRLHQLSWNAVNNKLVCPWRPVRNWQGILKFFWKGRIDKNIGRHFSFSNHIYINDGAAHHFCRRNIQNMRKQLWHITGQLMYTRLISREYIVKICTNSSQWLHDTCYEALLSCGWLCWNCATQYDIMSRHLPTRPWEYMIETAAENLVLRDLWSNEIHINYNYINFDTLYWSHCLFRSCALFRTLVDVFCEFVSKLLGSSANHNSTCPCKH